MTILKQMTHFSNRYRKNLIVNNTTWHYYRLGTGTPILWLTGGIRRAALGFAFMEKLAVRHTVIAPDYPPLHTIGEFISAFDAILEIESVEKFKLGGQSYGGMLAQAYLASKGDSIDQLILSSTGPANYSKPWMLVDYAFIALVRLLPEKTVKDLLAGGLLKIITLPQGERAEWVNAIKFVMQNDLTRADVVSHFAVAADLIRKGVVNPGAYLNWKGRVIVLSAENDATQSKKDIPHYEKLFGRVVEEVNMGDMGHTAAFFDPDGYVALLEQAIL